MEKYLLAAESWRGSARLKGNYMNRWRAHFKWNKTPRAILILVQVSGGLHGCNFLAIKSLLLKPEITRKVPKGFGGWKPHLESGGRNSLLPGSVQNRSQVEVLWVACGKPPPPSLAGAKQPPVPKAHLCFPMSFSVLQGKYLTLCLLEQRLQQVAQCCFDPNIKRAKAVTVIAVGRLLWSHLVNIKGLVHQQAVSLGNGVWDVQLMCYRKSNEILW